MCLIYSSAAVVGVKCEKARDTLYEKLEKGASGVVPARDVQKTSGEGILNPNNTGISWYPQILGPVWCWDLGNIRGSRNFSGTYPLEVFKHLPVELAAWEFTCMVWLAKGIQRERALLSQPASQCSLFKSRAVCQAQPIAQTCRQAQVGSRSHLYTDSCRWPEQRRKVAQQNSLTFSHPSSSSSWRSSNHEVSANFLKSIHRQHKGIASHALYLGHPNRLPSTD